VHAAARLGLFAKLKELILADPHRVHARGGDGQTPLHFASTIEITEYLLERGADIDARDVDHESTPAQYMVRSRQDIARYLIRRGCKVDILMAAALGDIALVKKLLDADPERIRMRVSSEYFPMVGDGKTGGTIYQWELGWHVSAVQVAKSFRHQEVFDLLMERSPAEEKLLNACWVHDHDMVQSLLARDPGLAGKLPLAGRRHVAHAARNNDTTAVRLMLTVGLPVDQVSQHHATALHWAGFHGNKELIRLLLQYHPPIKNANNEYKSTPLGWTIYGSVNGWHSEHGDYAGCVEALLEAGAKPPKEIGGSEAVREVLRLLL
jgi:ankyrin repeat protein